MDVSFWFTTAAGPRDVSVPGAVADSGTQVCILLSHYVLKLPAIPSSDNSHLVRLKEADNSDLNVTGVVDANLSAIANAGDRVSI